MSETQKKRANTLAIVVTWLSIVGAAAGAILTQIADLGVEVPTVVLSILSVLALAARRMPAVPVDSPRGSSLAIGLLVAVLAMAGVAPPDTFTGPASVTDAVPAGEVLDVVEPGEVFDGEDADAETWDGADPDVPLALYPAIGARLLVHGTLGMIGCTAAQTQAWKDAGEQFVQCMTAAGVPYAGDFVGSLFSDKIAINLVNIGRELWPSVVRCALAAGMPMLFPGGPAPMNDSVGATMTPGNRILSALSNDDIAESIIAACEGQPECWLVIVPDK